MFVGNCGDWCSTGLTGVVVLCTILIVQFFCRWEGDDGSMVDTGVVVTVKVMVDGVVRYELSTLCGF